MVWAGLGRGQGLGERVARLLSDERVSLIGTLVLRVTAAVLVSLGVCVWGVGRRIAPRAPAMCTHALTVNAHASRVALVGVA